MRHLLRIISVLAIALGVIGLAGSPAQAATDFGNAPSGAHYANGSSEPVCDFNATTATLSCSGTQIAGVGNTNATLLASVTSSFTGVCHNPGNYNVVTPFTRSSTASASIPLTPSRNGRLSVPSVTVNGTSTSEFQSTFTCPNPNWTADVTGSSVTWSYTLTFDGFSEPAISLP
jgi:hypothetical protein